MLATEIINSHSFLYNSFEDAKKTIRFKQGKRTGFIIFDCLSLCFYKHSLNQTDYSMLGDQLTFLFDKNGFETKKSRIEYRTLFYYRLLNDSLSGAIIKKEIRPDFIITLKGKKIGLEITELTTQKDKILHRISSQNYGKHLPAKEIKKRALEEHGIKANDYEYLQFHDTAAIGTGMFDTYSKKQEYAKEILTKISKYRKELGEFDEFIVLCDAQNTIAITTQSDADDVIAMVKHKIDCSGYIIAILAYESGNDRPSCYTFYL